MCERERGEELELTGVIMAATPTGCFITNIRLSTVGLGITSPYTLFASSENHSTNNAP